MLHESTSAQLLSAGASDRSIYVEDVSSGVASPHAGGWAAPLHAACARLRAARPPLLRVACLATAPLANFKCTLPLPATLAPVDASADARSKRPASPASLRRGAGAKDRLPAGAAPAAAASAQHPSLHELRQRRLFALERAASPSAEVCGQHSAGSSRPEPPTAVHADAAAAADPHAAAAAPAQASGTLQPAATRATPQAAQHAAASQQACTAPASRSGSPAPRERPAAQAPPAPSQGGDPALAQLLEQQGLAAFLPAMEEQEVGIAVLAASTAAELQQQFGLKFGPAKLLIVAAAAAAAPHAP